MHIMKCLQMYSKDFWGWVVVKGALAQALSQALAHALAHD